MLFTTLEFVLFFVVVLTTISIIKNRQFHHFFLLGVSLFFFYYSSNYLITILIASTLLDFYVGKAIWKTSNVSRKKILLIISLAGNLGLLGFFKYADFAILQFNIMGNYFNLSNEIPLLNLVWPIGISFYTFQTISYSVDIYRGNLTPSKSFWEFALFVSFFPQLVAGPIVRAKDFLPQLREKIENFETGERLRQIIINNSNLKLGTTLMAFGFLKKMFFADNIAPFVNEIFANPVGLDSFAIIMGTIGFGIQIYGDFSGYTDIAIGAALILGFKLPINFNKPYFATSPSDFWRRWHISLSTWVRDYVYYPLVFHRRNSTGVIFFSLILSFFILGIWHGAGWNFILFGILHGLYVSIDTILRKKFPLLRNNKFFKSKIGKIGAILGTQILVFFAWIPFRVSDTNDMLYSMEKFILVDIQINEIIPFVLNHKLPIALISLFIVLHYISYKKPNMIEYFSKLKHLHWTIMIFVILLTIVFFFDGNSEDFIYFRI
ncbi:MAG: MBOAT family protein [Crenarchaeota archaeon]|nr:MAG: MBOAT family protein [Thermoproteota archaeon]RDJ33352.1 MAG: MBOAT family protein [Thermoproteota archaeon]RDJ36144.1 MAG: MBOAT family protein [Thermoproteota archaeon]RDJ38776.1 MAG: MBOAT family protein [Thermoproteota archaeon]